MNTIQRHKIDMGQIYSAYPEDRVYCAVCSQSWTGEASDEAEAAQEIITIVKGKESIQELTKEINDCYDMETSREILDEIKAVLSIFHLDIFVAQHGEYMTINGNKIKCLGNMEYQEVCEHYTNEITEYLFENDRMSY